MNTHTHRLDLPALDGANPLGFLAALGTAVVYSEIDPSVRLGWYARARWAPFIETAEPLNADAFAATLVPLLRGQPVASDAQAAHKSAKKRYETAKKMVKTAADELKRRKLSRVNRDAERTEKIVPLESACEEARGAFLAALKRAVPSPEMAIGQRPDCSISEFRELAGALRGKSKSRPPVDLLAGFGAELAADADELILPTPWCFITGSGHQWFLDTARDLMLRSEAVKVREALFESWTNDDQKYGMRWDPVDDRRHALMDRDPTASDNKSGTVWMANLLAYRALSLFPCSPSGSAPGRGLAPTAAWTALTGSAAFTWPLWLAPLGVGTLRSLLGLRAFVEQNVVSFRHELRSRGVAAIFRCRRIQVGSPPLHKLNFTPSVAL